mmetsp:Transcript_960/g.1338  ORF Transcript_960/g.1338 Transcript_960/m.1338 type:complete len:502 (-) Transcript_960:1149-2654(-)
MMHLHPYGVEPEGNALLVGQAAAWNLRMRGLGLWLGILSDSLLIEWLHLLFPQELCALGSCSRAQLALTSIEDPWKAFLLEHRQDTCLTFLGTWKASVLGKKATYRSPKTALYSDVLYQPFRVVRARLDLREKESRETVSRISRNEFFHQAPCKQKPFIVRGWLSDDETKNERLFTHDPERICHAGGYEFKVKDFIRYSQNNMDDRPLYVFDKNFLDSTTVLKEIRYVPSDEDADDLFRYLDKEWRPDHHWLIAGGPGSGSTWHIDPNGTAAWNLCLAGSKRWFFAKSPPPGVHPSADGLDIATPVSVIDWYLAFYEQARTQIFECHVHSGDLVFVPSGWYHAVLNTELDGLTIAITQNFCSPQSLSHTLRLLRDRPHLVSGLGAHKHLYKDSSCLGLAFKSKLETVLQRHRPDLLDVALNELNRPSSLWAKIVHSSSFADAPSSGGFHHDSLSSVVKKQKNNKGRTSQHVLNDINDTTGKAEERTPASSIFTFDFSNVST